MNNTSDVWLNIEEVCSLTNSKKETIRRKCKSGEYRVDLSLQAGIKIIKFCCHLCL